MYIICKMSNSRKRNRSSSSSTSAKDNNKKLKEDNTNNDIIDDLKSLNYAEGLQYIIDNNLQEWLKNQIDSEAEMDTKDLWLTFYENNIYKEPNKIENLQPGPQVTMRGGQSVFKKRKNKTQKNIGGASSLTSMTLPVDKYFERHWNTLTVLTLKDNKGIEVCKVYGSSLPKNGGIPNLYKYLYDKIGIKDIISFQDCDNTQDLVHKNSCRKRGYNQTGSYSQAKIWEQISIPKQVTLSTGTRTARGTITSREITKFIVNEEKDMTAGAISNFDLLIQQPIWERRTLVHCLAGFGRTGTALLYYCIRTLLLYGIDGLNYTNLTHKFFGFTNTNFSSSLSSCVYMSSCMYNFFKIRFEMNLSLHTNNKWNSMVQGSIYHHSKMVEEVFKIDTINQANLFVARINYILLYTALFLNAQTDHDQFPGIQQSPIRASPIRASPITHIYLYPLHTQYPQQQSGRIVSMFTPDYIFKNPNLVNINHFDAQNEYGLKLKNIPQI
jgi:hypothetical protein